MFNRNKKENPKEEIKVATPEKPLTRRERKKLKHQKEKNGKVKTFVFAVLFFALATWQFVTITIDGVQIFTADGSWWEQFKAFWRFIWPLVPALGASFLSFLFSVDCVKSSHKWLKITSIIFTLASLAYIAVICLLAFLPK